MMVNPLVAMTVTQFPWVVLPAKRWHWVSPLAVPTHCNVLSLSLFLVFHNKSWYFHCLNFFSINLNIFLKKWFTLNLDKNPKQFNPYSIKVWFCLKKIPCHNGTLLNWDLMGISFSSRLTETSRWWHFRNLPPFFGSHALWSSEFPELSSICTKLFKSLLTAKIEIRAQDLEVSKAMWWLFSLFPSQ